MAFLTLWWGSTPMPISMGPVSKCYRNFKSQSVCCHWFWTSSPIPYFWPIYSHDVPSRHHWSDKRYPYCYWRTTSASCHPCLRSRQRPLCDDVWSKSTDTCLDSNRSFPWVFHNYKPFISDSSYRCIFQFWTNSIQSLYHTIPSPDPQHVHKNIATKALRLHHAHVVYHTTEFLQPKSLIWRGRISTAVIHRRTFQRPPAQHYLTFRNSFSWPLVWEVKFTLSGHPWTKFFVVSVLLCCVLMMFWLPMKTNTTVTEITASIFNASTNTIAIDTTQWLFDPIPVEFRSHYLDGGVVYRRRGGKMLFVYRDSQSFKATRLFFSIIVCNCHFIAGCWKTIQTLSGLLQKGSRRFLLTLTAKTALHPVISHCDECSSLNITVLRTDGSVVTVGAEFHQKVNSTAQPLPFYFQ